MGVRAYQDDNIDDVHIVGSVAIRAKELASKMSKLGIVGELLEYGGSGMVCLPEQLFSVICKEVV